tara:strand:- start:126426 stop:127985 length:1560 start_codon:yes stop_codon:yes gene_type:complete
MSLYSIRNTITENGPRYYFLTVSEAIAAWSFKYVKAYSPDNIPRVDGPDDPIMKLSESQYTDRWFFPDSESNILEVWEMTKEISSDVLTKESFEYKFATDRHVIDLLKQVTYRSAIGFKGNQEVMSRAVFGMMHRLIQNQVTQKLTPTKRVNVIYQSLVKSSSIDESGLLLKESIKIHWDTIALVVYDTMVSNAKISSITPQSEYNELVKMLDGSFSIPERFNRMFTRNAVVNYAPQSPNDESGVRVLLGDTTMEIFKHLTFIEANRFCSVAGVYRSWCQRHERQIWQYLLLRDFPTRCKCMETFPDNLFNSSPKEFYKLLNAPAKFIEIDSSAPRVAPVGNGFAEYATKEEQLVAIQKSLDQLNEQYRQDIIDARLVDGDIVFTSRTLIMYQGKITNSIKWNHLSKGFDWEYAIFPEYTIGHWGRFRPNINRLKLSEKSLIEAEETFRQGMSVKSNYNFNITDRSITDTICITKDVFDRYGSKEELFKAVKSENNWTISSDGYSAAEPNANRFNTFRN